MIRSIKLNKNKNYILKSTLTTTTTTNDDRINYLKNLFQKFHKPLFYKNYLLENSQIKSLKRASVLIPIIYNQHKNDYEFLLTKRTDHLRTHKGQICFVGGMKDEHDENEIKTAYREAKEEIGLEENALTFLAQLVPVCTSAGVLVTPIVAYLDKNKFIPKLNKNEVDFMFEISTKRFLDKTNHKSKMIGLREKFYVHYFDDFKNDRLINTWGVTAFLSICVSSVINSKQPEFDVDPTSKLTSENLNEFLEHYLTVKSKSLITAYAAKSKVTESLKKLF